MLPNCWTGKGYTIIQKKRGNVKFTFFVDISHSTIFFLRIYRGKVRFYPTIRCKFKDAPIIKPERLGAFLKATKDTSWFSTRAIKFGNTEN
jgi:hypothetical protein